MLSPTQSLATNTRIYKYRQGNPNSQTSSVRASDVSTTGTIQLESAAGAVVNNITTDGTSVEILESLRIDTVAQDSTFSYVLMFLTNNTVKKINAADLFASAFPIFDGLYLRLDAANSPVTGDLSVENSSGPTFTVDNTSTSGVNTIITESGAQVSSGAGGNTQYGGTSIVLNRPSAASLTLLTDTITGSETQNWQDATGKIAVINAGAVDPRYVPIGPVTTSGLTQTTNRLLGRTTASTGPPEEITVGSGLSLSAGSLTATGGAGTVTSVAETFTGGLISVAGSPITGSGTLALTVAGTSGGIPYFDSSSSWASSAALLVNRLVLGGGAGAAPTVLGSLGTTTTVLHGNAAGAPTFGAVSLTADVSGVTPIANGGTNGTSTPTAGGVAYGTGSALGWVGAGTTGQVLTSAGAGTPTWSTPTSNGPEVLYVDEAAGSSKTYSMPGGTLDTVGQELRIYVVLTGLATAETVTLTMDGDPLTTSALGAIASGQGEFFVRVVYETDTSSLTGMNMDVNGMVNNFKYANTNLAASGFAAGFDINVDSSASAAFQMFRVEKWPMTP